MVRLKKIESLIIKGILSFFVIYFGTPLVGAFLPSESHTANPSDLVPVLNSAHELERLGLVSNTQDEVLAELMQYQKKTGYSLSQILRDEQWCNKLGFESQVFRATWYIANPFDLLPPHLQKSIRERENPFKTRAQVWEWCRAMKYGAADKKALKAALIETTPSNLWRASRGLPPYTKSGKILKPVVIDLEMGGSR